MTPKPENNSSHFSELLQRALGRNVVGVGVRVDGPKSSPDSNLQPLHIGANGHAMVKPRIRLRNPQIDTYSKWACFSDDSFQVGPSPRTAYLNWEAEFYRRFGRRPN